MKMTSVTLADYANNLDRVVLFWTSAGTPTGDYAPLGHPDLDFAERRRLLGLTGTVDGDWCWDGIGSPTDDSANTITRLEAYVDVPLWEKMVNGAVNEIEEVR